MKKVYWSQANIVFFLVCFLAQTVYAANGYNKEYYSPVEVQHETHNGEVTLTFSGFVRGFNPKSGNVYFFTFLNQRHTLSALDFSTERTSHGHFEYSLTLPLVAEVFERFMHAQYGTTAADFYLNDSYGNYVDRQYVAVDTRELFTPSIAGFSARAQVSGDDYRAIVSGTVNNLQPEFYELRLCPEQRGTCRETDTVEFTSTSYLDRDYAYKSYSHPRGYFRYQLEVVETFYPFAIKKRYFTNHVSFTQPGISISWYKLNSEKGTIDLSITAQGFTIGEDRIILHTDTEQDITDLLSESYTTNPGILFALKDFPIPSGAYDLRVEIRSPCTSSTCNPTEALASTQIDTIDLLPEGTRHEPRIKQIRQTMSPYYHLLLIEVENYHRGQILTIEEENGEKTTLSQFSLDGKTVAYFAHQKKSNGTTVYLKPRRFNRVSLSDRLYLTDQTLGTLFDQEDVASLPYLNETIPLETINGSRQGILYQIPERAFPLPGQPTPEAELVLYAGVDRDNNSNTLTISQDAQYLQLSGAYFGLDSGDRETIWNFAAKAPNFYQSLDSTLSRRVNGGFNIAIPSQLAAYNRTFELVFTARTPKGAKHVVIPVDFKSPTPPTLTDFTAFHSSGKIFVHGFASGNDLQQFKIALTPAELGWQYDVSLTADGQQEIRAWASARSIPNDEIEFQLQDPYLDYYLPALRTEIVSIEEQEVQSTVLAATPAISSSADLNFDGKVTAEEDSTYFVMAVEEPQRYQALTGHLATERADYNKDGIVDYYSDLAAFLALIR